MSPTAPMRILTLPRGLRHGGDDFTFFLPRAALTLPEGRWSWDERIDFPGRDGSRYTARGLVCACSSGMEWSVTVRKPEPDTPLADPYPSVSAGVLSRYLAPGVSSVERDRYVYGIDAVCDALYQPLLGLTGRPHGLLLITGTTGAAKSTLARGLIWKYLKSKLQGRPRRRPHLLTFERPIETTLAARADADTTPREIDDAAVEEAPSILGGLLGIDYTARQEGVDYHSLEDALLGDALRQTPSAVYVGEVRKPEEWKHVLAFARTGHLVVTTAHAGSLVEAMARLFREGGVLTAHQRGHLAETLLGVIHLATLEGQSPAGTAAPAPAAVSVAVWRRTPAGIAGLVENGLSSVLPHNPSSVRDLGPDGLGSLGRRWFLAAVRSFALADPTNPFEQNVKALMAGAIRLDLRGA